MQSTVIIVESPSKAKALNSYFENKVLVLSSKGHIRDLSYKGKDNLGIDIDNNFCPNYQIIPRQKELLKKILKISKGKKVLLATDPDREGEAIAWHLSEVLGLRLKDKNRITFNEINKNTVLEAFKHPESIKKNLVDSQEARRILDRIIGFKLSKLIRKKSAKSAGRVQSVALKLIVEIEEERKKFISEKYYLIKAFFDQFEVNLEIEKKKKIVKEEYADKIVLDIKNQNFLLSKIIKKKIINKPPKPFITSTLQQEAFKKISMSAKTTMLHAQKLYEGVKIENKIIGLITYMRTDSYRISSSFTEKIKSFIINEYGKEYLNVSERKNILQNKIQDAHEAIRPTDILMTPENLKKYLNKYELSLYKIIYERTLASFMSNAIFEKTEFFFNVKEYIFSTESNKMIFDGFYKILKNDFKYIDLSFLKINQKYLPKKIEKIEKETNPPAYFTEASLIKKLENLKIGRPSTYAHIIEILKKRFYVYIENKKIICTKLGMSIKKTLEDFFPSIINIEYTSKIEKKLDDIYYGKISKLDFLTDFYNDFIILWDIANKKIQKENILTQEKCSLCNDFLVRRIGRYGEFLGCNSFPKCKNIISLKEKKENILTQEKCSLCNDFLVRRIGRYGEFLGCNSFPKCKNMVTLKNKKEKK
ncbi:MAG: DNA topoisomerase I [Candidatus Phytoplasma cynodontis]|uniref:type I DNA topoisomerase n=1 Tax='Cynodon dactylon' phytoplasma TaxID=295320 RepID=UPI001265D21D|nr:type I DNA topoisomerase ['Cynodon dactylon' phytoplasma]KAB8121936.1 type I DNA topoisomerase ['Cynodon dactylon' phytoplasma]WIA07655.1 MAG: DNA topoisomerase I [Candidatus Phytoplasma cynodontis]